MNTNLIRMFNKEISSDTESKFIDFNSKSIPLGYIIHPNCCTNDVARFLLEEKKNVNSTFQKTWKDVINKTETEMLNEQLLHYISTYGTNFSIGNGYVPNCFPKNVKMETFKLILPTTVEEIGKEIKSVLESGIALKTDTINSFLEFIVDNDIPIDIDKIKNKETQCIFSVFIGKLPTDEFGLLRVLVYAATKSSMLIKSKEMIGQIRNSKNEYVAKLTDKQMKNLSRIFYRYKPLFLAMKNKDTSKNINKIRRYAKKYHTPLEVGFWESCFIKEDLERAKIEVKNINNFKKIVILQSIRERILSRKATGKMFIIRNGKMFVREDYQTKVNVDYLRKLYHIVEDSVVKSLSQKACTYSITEGVHIAAPTSEKNFLGNYPMGTSIDCGTSHNIFGIYWRNEWGTKDFDLHFFNEYGEHIGWNSHLKGDKILFSGDMTYADPEASELFYIEKGVPNGYITVNQFSGNHGSKLRLFVAKEDMHETLKKGIMCNPNNIKFEAMINIDEGEKTIGYVCDNKIYLMELDSGRSRVSSGERAEIIINQIGFKSKSFVDLEKLLDKAGFVKEEKNSVLDLTNPSKESLIKLFS